MWQAGFWVSVPVWGCWRSLGLSFSSSVEPCRVGLHFTNGDIGAERCDGMFQKAGVGLLVKLVTWSQSCILGCGQAEKCRYPPQRAVVSWGHGSWVPCPWDGRVE